MRVAAVLFTSQTPFVENIRRRRLQKLIPIRGTLITEVHEILWLATVGELRRCVELVFLVPEAMALVGPGRWILPEIDQYFQG